MSTFVFPDAKDSRMVGYDGYYALSPDNRIGSYTRSEISRLNLYYQTSNNARLRQLKNIDSGYSIFKSRTQLYTPNF